VIDTLVRASSAFVGAPAPSGAARATLEAGLERMTAALAPRERRLLRLGVAVLGVLSRLSSGRAFPRLDDAAARKLLDRVGGSRIAALRRLHMSVRMMTQLAWYSDPARWAECGYDGPWLGRIAVDAGPPPDLGPTP
jgi:hypothetical protein